jgi:tryptophanyl-tRNA synthetase
VCNLFSLHGFLSPPEVVDEVATACRTAARGCLDCKKILHRHLMETLAPIQARAAELDAHPGRVREVLDQGAERCRAIARETLREVRDRLGLDWRAQ